jgi:hypothetical protein
MTNWLAIKQYFTVYNSDAQSNDGSFSVSRSRKKILKVELEEICWGGTKTKFFKDLQNSSFFRQKS